MLNKKKIKNGYNRTMLSALIQTRALYEAV